MKIIDNNTKKVPANQPTKILLFKEKKNPKFIN